MLWVKVQEIFVFNIFPPRYSEIIFWERILDTFLGIKIIDKHKLSEMIKKMHKLGESKNTDQIFIQVLLFRPGGLF